MSAILCPVLKQRFFDNNGAPLAGGQVFSYLAGTTTPASTFTDETGLVANANPVVLDGNGYAPIWLGAGAYKFVVEDSLGNVIFTVDEVSVNNSSTGTSPWVEYSVTDGQTATALSGATLDLSLNSSAMIDVEIIRGTTVSANGSLSMQGLNGTGQVSVGAFMAQAPHGVTFSVSQVGTVVQLLAACSSGPGSGTIKLYTRSLPLT